VSARWGAVEVSASGPSGRHRAQPGRSVVRFIAWRRSGSINGTAAGKTTHLASACTSSIGGAAGGDYAVTDTWDITGGDVLEAIRWAQDRAGRDGLYAVAVVRDELNFREDEHPSRGLVWLVGMDWFDDVAGDVDGQRTKDRMIARRGQAVVSAEPP
jgi:hypothetical protein